MTEPPFDVFLCHNSADKPSVEKITIQLRDRGLRPWLDIWELQPGLPWQRALEARIQSIGAAAVFVGSEGRGPYREAAERLAEGFLEADFPEGSFPPGLPYVPYFDVAARGQPI